MINNDRFRPGLKARKPEHLARDLMLAKDVADSGRSQSSGVQRGEAVGRRGRAIFLVGAGCSFSAGIPLASGVAQRCAGILAEQYFPDDALKDTKSTPAQSLDVLISNGIVPGEFKISQNEIRWGDLYTYFFSEHLKSPNHQREVISSIISEHESDLNWAHACLGQLVHDRYVHTVLTTNFDQLVLQGIFRTGITPVVADGLESLVRIDPSPVRPQVVHLHGSMHTYDLRNSPRAVIETESDAHLQNTMMSLLRRSTVLIVIGYGGGEEGVMRLLQLAAENIPRLVVYWVSHSRNYYDLSRRAQRLLETGDNKFFILDQDADHFFQRLMVELSIGQPGWIADPIGALKQQSDTLRPIKSPTRTEDYEISGLVEGYTTRVDHALAHPVTGDREFVEAQQLKSSGMYDQAIAKLKPIKNEKLLYRTLYAQSLQEAFDSHFESNQHRISEAIEEFEHIYSTSRPFQFRRAEDLIEALFDGQEKQEEEEVDKERKLKRIIDVVETSRTHVSKSDRREFALLDFYHARAFQELSDIRTPGHADPGRKVIDGYRRTVRHQEVLGDKLDEAREGLSQALAYYVEKQIENKPDLTKRKQMKRYLDEAIQIQIELVDNSWANLENTIFAARLENLASNYGILADLYERNSDKQKAKRRAVEALVRASAAYKEVGDKAKVAELEGMITELSPEDEG